MKISELQETLAAIRAEYGDLEILGGFLSHDGGLSAVAVLNKDGAAVYHSGGEPVGIFFE